MRGLAVVAAIWLLAGCAHQRLPETVTDQQALYDLAQSFEVRGKLGLSSAGRGYNAGLRWTQLGPLIDLQVQGPIGIGRTRVQGTPDAITITDSKGQSQFYDNPAAALTASLGWSLPLQSLRFWALGLPDPAQPARQLAASDGTDGGPRFEQAGWQVDVTQTKAVGPHVLPRKITLTQGTTRVRLVISNWDFVPQLD